MDLTSLLVTVGVTFATMLAVSLAGAWAAVRWMRRAGLLWRSTPPTAVVELEDDVPALGGLTVLNEPRLTCASCSHYNLDAGQRVMRTQPAFFAATSHLQPWEMARQRPVTPNPEYERIEALMLAAAEAGETKEARKLHDALLALDPGELGELEGDVSPALLNTDWTKLGACARHQELRFASDVCAEHRA